MAQAGLALAVRDRGGPPLRGQVLDYPMLDDRGVTASTAQFDGIGVWDRVSNETGWRALLGDAVAGPEMHHQAEAGAEHADALQQAERAGRLAEAELQHQRGRQHGGDAEQHGERGEVVEAGGPHAGRPCTAGAART